MRSCPRAREPVDFVKASSVDLPSFSVATNVRLADAEMRKIISHADLSVNGLS